MIYNVVQNHLYFFDSWCRWKNETVTCIFIYFENVTVLWNNDRVVNYKAYWIFSRHQRRETTWSYLGAKYNVYFALTASGSTSDSPVYREVLVLVSICAVNVWQFFRLRFWKHILSIFVVQNKFGAGRPNAVTIYRFWTNQCYHFEIHWRQIE